MTLEDALDYIDDKIAKLEPKLLAKEAEAERRGWLEGGKKLQAVVELSNHIISLNRIKTLLEREP